MKFRILRFRELPSTNTLALQYAKEGEAEGLVLVADYQTAGRGKPGSKWVSPPSKNLLFSVLLRPPIPPHRAPILTQIACRSVAHVLKHYCRIESSFKRPNDLMVKDRKICGVLVEASSKSNGYLESVVVGIGLNVNAIRPQLLISATSIKELRGRSYDKKLILNRILTELGKDLKTLYARAA